MQEYNRPKFTNFKSKMNIAISYSEAYVGYLEELIDAFSFIRRTDNVFGITSPSRKTTLLEAEKHWRKKIQDILYPAYDELLQKRRLARTISPGIFYRNPKIYLEMTACWNRKTRADFRKIREHFAEETINIRSWLTTVFQIRRAEKKNITIEELTSLEEMRGKQLLNEMVK